jgi:twitching motility protein PilT
VANEFPTLDTEQTRQIVQTFHNHLNSTILEGVSDVHFVGGDVAWPVQFGRPLRSVVQVSNNDVLAWAEVFAKTRGGANALIQQEKGSLEAMAIVGKRRLRMAFRRQITGFGLTLRVVPEIPPRLTDALFMDNPVPPALVDLSLNAPAGLILACGPTGSGKSTMLAALLAEVNNQQHKHIYTIEDPIEFVHKTEMSILTQREVGIHTESFVQALRDSMRSRPNIILVGELLDLETIRVAIEAGNKGHLVFATSHAASAEEAVSSLVSKFPGDEQNHIATSLSQVLRAAVVQRLVPTVTKRLVPARELLLNTTAVASKIRGSDFTSITQRMNPTEGMFRIERDLATLWAQGKIDEDAALANCNDREEMEKQLQYAKTHRDELAAAQHWAGVAN